MLVAAGRLPSVYGDAACNQLPRPPPLLGRDTELAMLRNSLQRVRRSTIVGGPGEGKSALAAEAAYLMYEGKMLPGGVFMVDLAAAVLGGEHVHVIGPAYPCRTPTSMHAFCVHILNATCHWSADGHAAVYRTVTEQLAAMFNTMKVGRL
jgi:hypothetical protein